MSRQEILDDPGLTLPQLRQFMGAYFHQDWPLDGKSWEDVVDDYTAESTRSDIRETAAEVRSLLAERLGEAELASILDDLGGSVNAAAFQLSTTDWLGRVEARLLRSVS